MPNSMPKTLFFVPKAIVSGRNAVAIQPWRTGDPKGSPPTMKEATKHPAVKMTMIKSLPTDMPITFWANRVSAGYKTVDKDGRCGGAEIPRLSSTGSHTELA